MWEFFKTLLSSLPLPHSNLSQTQISFHSKPINFKFKSLQNLFKGMFLNNIFTLFLDYAEKFLGLSWIGDFQKRVGFTNFGQNFFKILIGLCPICHDCIFVGPLWQFELVFRHIFICSCIAHMCNIVLHSKCLTKCSSGIFELVWTQMSSFVWVYPWLNLFNMLWSLGVCFTHFAQLCLTMPCHASPRHASCTPHAH